MFLPQIIMVNLYEQRADDTPHYFLPPQLPNRPNKAANILLIREEGRGLFNKNNSIIN